MGLIRQATVVAVLNGRTADILRLQEHQHQLVAMVCLSASRHCTPLCKHYCGAFHSVHMSVKSYLNWPRM